jgi:hypothetical protein
MKKKVVLDKELLSEYKGLLDSLSKEYINEKIDINTLELKYRGLANNIAKKYRIATPFPFTSEYNELDDYGKKVIENSIGRRFPRPAIQRIIEDCSTTEPALVFDKSWFESFLKEIKGQVKNKNLKI